MVKSRQMLKGGTRKKKCDPRHQRQRRTKKYKPKSKRLVGCLSGCSRRRSQKRRKRCNRK